MKLVLVVVVLPGLSLALALYAPFSARSALGNVSQKRSDETDTLFIKNCSSCHGNDGRAKTFKAKFNHAQDLTKPKWQASITDEHMFLSILKGKGKMPAFRKKLSENDIGALVTYVRMLKR